MVKQELIQLCKQQEQLKQVLLQLPKNNLTILIKMASKAKKEKYEYTHEVLYGDLPRGFTPEQLRRFILNLRTMKLRRQFLRQFFYALRIGELNKLEVLKEQRILRIWNEKCDSWDHIPIHGPTGILFEDLAECEYSSPHDLRIVFQNTLKRLGLDFVYHITGNGNHLHQFTPHSLRHTGITIFNDFINNPIKCMKFSRHRPNHEEYGCLGTYITYRTETLRQDLEQAFMPYYDLIRYGYMPVDTRRMADLDVPKYARVHKPKSEKRYTPLLPLPPA